MKVRDSGMPEQAFWESLFDPEAILNSLQVDSAIGDVVEVGCGYGTFTIPVAARIRGMLHAFDIDPAMIEATRARVAAGAHRNIELSQRDVIADGFCLPLGSVDAVLLFNILHAENPTELLHSSAELLRPGGRVLVIHWRSDVPTPRGPDLSIRPRPEKIIGWATSAGLRIDSSQLLPPWHFGLVLRR